MATIKFSIKSKKNFAPIYVRMQHSKLFDFKYALPLYIEKKNFDIKTQRIKRVYEIPNHEELNQALSNLKNQLFAEFNTGIISGQNFTKNWFDNVVLKFFNIKTEDKSQFERIFFSDWCNYWIENIAPNYKISSEKYLEGKNLQKYTKLRAVFKEFEKGKKITFKSLDQSILDQFGNFLVKDKKYSYDHCRKVLQTFRFFCTQAEKKGIEINPEWNTTVILSKETKKDCVDPYLSPDEIQKLYSLDLSDNDRLDNTRDNLIISVWTGLRVSDFLRLKIDNIQGSNIEIQSTQKTGIGVIIPIHPMVQSILDKRNGNLPRSLSDQKYNEYVKEVAEIAGFNQVIYGSKTQVLTDENGNEIKDHNGKKIIRKVMGEFPKHELVTSHIGRRSFATNLFGKVPNSVIMATGGWKSESMMLKYIKKTKNDHVEILAKFWSNQETPSNELKVVNQ